MWLDKNSVMTEQQILKKIEVWSDEDDIQAVVDFIESLSVEDKTPEVLNELGRAYNNLYWLNPTEENKHYLRRAIEVFKYIEPELGNTDSWNYRIGYSYFFLGDLPNAKYYLQKDISQWGGTTQELLNFIAIAEEKNLSLSEVMEGGQGGIEFVLERFINTLQEYAPQMLKRLRTKATKKSIDTLEKRLQFSFPENFKQLHRTFDGQEPDTTFFFGRHTFVAINEIEPLQQEWLNFVLTHYGKNWQQVTMPSVPKGVVKNQLYNPKWLPIISVRIGDEDKDEILSYICTDLDNDSEGTYGQIMAIVIAKDLTKCSITILADDLQDWFDYFIRNIKNGLFQYDEETDDLIIPADHLEEIPVYSKEEKITVEHFIKKKFGKVSKVLHEELAPDVWCDILVVAPTAQHNYYTLVTKDMGDYPMNILAGDDETVICEMVMHLPPTWNSESTAEEHRKPIEWIKKTVQISLEQGLFISRGNTILVENETLKSDKFAFLLAVTTLDNDGEELCCNISKHKFVLFNTFVPIYTEEMLYRWDNDEEELLSLLENDKQLNDFITGVPLRTNLCANYEPMIDASRLDKVQWAFTQEPYYNMADFYEAFKRYNDDVGNDLEDFNPFGTLFLSPRVKVLYQAQIKDVGVLNSFEFLTNENALTEGTPDAEGFYDVHIVAQHESGDGVTIGALELLFFMHNTLHNKYLGKRIFFNGFELQGYENDGTPVIFILCSD